MTTRTIHVRSSRFEAQRLSIRLSLTALFLLLSSTLAFSQASSGAASISGQVRDTSGGVMPRVEIQVRNVATNVVRVLESNEVGRYEAVALAIG
jgi:hypothetical protein